MENGNKKFNIWEPITSPIGEPYPFEVYEDYEEEEEWKDEYYELLTQFLMAKIIQLYIHFDPMNFEQNRQNLEDEINTFLKNQIKKETKNEKPNTSYI